MEFKSSARWNLKEKKEDKTIKEVILKTVAAFFNSEGGTLLIGVADDRDLPSDYGDWKNTQRRFCRWRDKGVWERLLDILIDEPDYEWLTIDASHIKVHPHGTGATGGNQQTGRTKGGLTPRYIWPWMRMVCRLESLSLKVPVLIARKLCH